MLQRMSSPHFPDREGTAFTFDSTRHEVVMFGGAWINTGTETNETWVRPVLANLTSVASLRGGS